MPIHVAITRRVRPGCEVEFQQALREFFQASFTHGGVLGATMIVPPPGSDSREFGILRTFANEKDRDDFYASPIFNQRIVVGSEHSKSVFVSAEIIRVDFLHHSFQCWQFPGGWSDIVELSEEEFRTHAHLDQPELMVKREQPTPPGDLLVSFVRLHLRGGQPLFVMVEAPAKLPAESQSFMHFLLSKAAVHMRLRGGGISVVNLANLAGYTVYPGVAQIPADSWIAEPVVNSLH